MRRGLVPPIEALDSRLLLSVQTYSGSLSGKIVFTSGGHGWQWNNSLGRYATDRGDSNEIVEDFNQEQMTAYADYLLRAGATVVPMRPVGRSTTSRCSCSAISSKAHRCSRRGFQRRDR